jgi:hypothetical protein
VTTTTKTAIAAAPGDDRILRSRREWVASTLPLPLHLARQAALAPLVALRNRLGGRR